MEFEWGQQRERIALPPNYGTPVPMKHPEGVVLFFLVVWPVVCGNCSSETIGPFAHSSASSLCVYVCFPHTTRAKSEEPAGVGCQAHYLVDILYSSPVETLPNYRPYALLRGFESQ